MNKNKKIPSKKPFLHRDYYDFIATRACSGKLGISS